VATPAAPTESAVGLRTAGPAWAHLGAGARSVADVLRHYRGKRLAEILQSVERGPPATATSPSPPLLDVVADFHRWIPYAPVSGKCLLRSFMLLRLLRRRGHDALWVFGVRTWPFYAHCWLQCGDVVLDDDVERVTAFTPIMAV
jgi:hypothetical protein